MRTFHIQTAGLVACVCTEYRPSASLYKDFRTDKPADFSITLTDDDFNFSYAAAYGKVSIIGSEMLRKISDALIDFDVILFHGAAIAIAGQVYLFAAPSGTGKTTHIKQWLKCCADAFVVNGDKPFIRFNDDNTPPLVCGSPWAGKENMYTNTMLPLRSIILMDRAEDNHIEQIPFAKAFPGLLQQVYLPADEEKKRKTLQLMQRFNPAVSFWRFQCNNFKEDCFEVAYKALVGNSDE